MRWLKLLAYGLFVLIVTLVLIAYVLPARQSVQRHRDMTASAAKIWPLLADPKAWTRWAAWNRRDPEMKITYTAAEAGAGAAWSWESKSQGKGSMHFDSAEPERLLTYTLTFPDMGSAAKGRIALTPIATGTRVTWSFETELGNNPAVRWFGLMIPGMVGKDFDEGLANLDQMTR